MCFKRCEVGDAGSGQAAKIGKPLLLPIHDGINRAFDPHCATGFPPRRVPSTYASWPIAGLAIKSDAKLNARFVGSTFHRLVEKILQLSKICE
jgi:hypothetical protein